MSKVTSLKYGRAYVFGVVAIACLGWGVYSTLKALRPPESLQVRLAAGPTMTRRFQIAEALTSEARRHDLHIELVPTAGFEDSVRQVTHGELDLALVSSGLEMPECKDTCVLAGLDIAPLHILVRRHLAEKQLTLSEMIQGRRVNLGQKGTNDFLLASDLMRFLRLQPAGEAGQGDFTPTLLSKEELVRLAERAMSTRGPAREEVVRALPDVILTIASLPGVDIQSLLDTGEYCLVPFDYTEPFLLSDLHHVGGAEEGVDRILVESVAIQPGMYLGKSVMPATECRTIGLRTLLIARADLPAKTVKRAMECVFETDFERRVKPKTPREFATAYHTHPAAEKYLDRDQPLLTGTFVESISTVFSVFGAFSAGALSLYGYLRRRRIRRPGEYLEEIRKIDALASGKQPGIEAPLSHDLLELELDTRLNQLKEQVICDYCENRVQGEMVLLSILSTLADSRSRLHAAHSRSTAAANAGRPVPTARPSFPGSAQAA